MAGALLPIATGVASFFGGRRRQRRAQRAFEESVGRAEAILRQIETGEFPAIEAPIQLARSLSAQRAQQDVARRAAARAAAGIAETSPLARAQERSALQDQQMATASLLANLLGQRQQAGLQAGLARAQLGADIGTQRAQFALNRPGIEELIASVGPPLAQFASGSLGPRNLRTFVGLPRRNRITANNVTNILGTLFPGG